jgi:CRISPR/Cas system-associated exonuclease Cas4 (RecB family)
MIRLSPTAVNAYYGCPRRFFYHYIEKIKVKPNIHLLKGIVVHSVMESFYNKYGNDYYKLLDKFWKLKLPELKLTGANLEDEYNDCKNILKVDETILKVKLEGLAASGKFKNENEAFDSIKPRFSEEFLESKALNLCCKIDRIDINRFTGITTLGDYKTSKMYGIELSEDYLRQHVIMAIIYNEVKGTLPNFGVTIFLRYGLSDRVRITSDLVKWGFDQINYVNEKIKSTKIEDYPKKEVFCKYCDYFDICSNKKKLVKSKLLDAMTK